MFQYGLIHPIAEAKLLSAKFIEEGPDAGHVAPLLCQKQETYRADVLQTKYGGDTTGFALIEQNPVGMELFCQNQRFGFTGIKFDPQVTHFGGIWNRDRVNPLRLADFICPGAVRRNQGDFRIDGFWDADFAEEVLQQV